MGVMIFDKTVSRSGTKTLPTQYINFIHHTPRTAQVMIVNHLHRKHLSHIVVQPAIRLRSHGSSSENL